MNHNRPPLITGIPSDAELAAQLPTQLPEESPWAPPAQQQESTWSTLAVRHAAAETAEPGDEAFDYATFGGGHENTSEVSDPYLDNFTKYDGVEGDALPVVGWSHPDGGAISNLPVVGRGLFNGEPFLKVIGRDANGDPAESYIPEAQAVEPVRAQITMPEARTAMTPASEATQEVAHEDWPTLSAEEARTVIAAAHEQAAVTQTPARAEYDAQGRSLYKPRPKV